MKSNRVGLKIGKLIKYYSNQNQNQILEYIVGHTLEKTLTKA